MLFDTTFLIDLEREARQQREGAATRFLIGHPAEALAVSIITTGEFAEGYAADGQAACWAALSLYAVLDLDRETVCWGRSFPAISAQPDCPSGTMTSGSRPLPSGMV
jgi:predicted nucleic acid-binding protein